MATAERDYYELLGVERTATEAEIKKSIAEFDTATLETFTKVKSTVDKSIAKLKGEIASVRAKFK